MVKILIFGDLDQPNGVNYENSEHDVKVYWQTINYASSYQKAQHDLEAE